jgi:hypothetical protein
MARFAMRLIFLVRLLPHKSKVQYDEVIFSAAKTPTKVTLICTPTGYVALLPRFLVMRLALTCLLLRLRQRALARLRPLSVECLINRPNLPQPVVVQPSQISIHDDTSDQRYVIQYPHAACCPHL